MAFNGTSILGVPVPAQDAWSGFVAEAQKYLPQTYSQLALLAFVNLPIIAIVLNVLRQTILPRDKSLPPEVFHFIPYFGSAASYGDDPIKFFFDCKKKYGDVFTYTMLGRKMTVALGSKGNNFILGGKTQYLSAEDAYTHLTTPVFGKDVVYDIPNERFMEQKKFVKVGLTTDNFRAYVPMIENEVTQFMANDSSFATYQQDDITAWGHFDPLKVTAEITILTASRTLQGQEVREGLDKGFAETFSDLDGGFTPLHFVIPNLPLPSYRKRDAAQKKMSDFYVDLIRKRREGITSSDGTDMISALMSQTYRGGRPLPDHEIAHIMIALLMAGQHTSSTTGSWTMLHIAQRPDIQDALYAEQVKHFRESDGHFRTPTYEELKALPVLDSVIRETLRMHPPIHSIMRKVRQDMPVPPTLAAPSKDGTYVVPAGHYVMASPAISQIDPTLWHEADRWLPERWNDEAGEAAAAFKLYTDENGEKVDYGFGAVSKGTESPYQPFGAGRHRCIGEQFAYLQLGALIATMVQRIEMKLPTPFPGQNYHTMITMPKSPREIYYRRRVQESEL
ncbi:cytochrome P450 [Peniophora sp. CONT]|nr:cytochrome P450 [Peniophora sp. CONT]